MYHDLPAELRKVADQLQQDNKYTESIVCYSSANRIEKLVNIISDLEGALEDANHFRDYWFDRATSRDTAMAAVRIPKKVAVPNDAA